MTGGQLAVPEFFWGCYCFANTLVTNYMGFENLPQPWFSQEPCYFQYMFCNFVEHEAFQEHIHCIWEMPVFLCHSYKARIFLSYSLTKFLSLLSNLPDSLILWKYLINVCFNLFPIISSKNSIIIAQRKCKDNSYCEKKSGGAGNPSFCPIEL